MAARCTSARPPRSSGTATARLITATDSDRKGRGHEKCSCSITDRNHVADIRSGRSPRSRYCGPGRQFHHRRSDSKRSGIQSGAWPRAVLRHGPRDLRVRLPRDLLRQRIPIGKDEAMKNAAAALLTVTTLLTSAPVEARDRVIAGLAVSSTTAGLIASAQGYSPEHGRALYFGTAPAIFGYGYRATYYGNGFRSERTRP